MRLPRLRILLGLAGLSAVVLAGCSGSPSAPPAPPTASQAAAAANNPAVNQILANPKTSAASAEYVKSHMPNAPSAGQTYGR